MPIAKELNPPPAGSILARVAELEAKPRKKRPATGALEKAISKALRAGKGNDDNPQLEDFREQLFAELYKLIPDAIKQAKGTQRTPGKPALLRLLIRATK